MVDCGWPFTKQVAELVYGWQKLKIKDTYRTEFDPLKGAESEHQETTTGLFYHLKENIKLVYQEVKRKKY